MRPRWATCGPAAGVTFGGRDPNLSRDAKGMTAAGRLKSLAAGQRFTHRLLIHAERCSDRPQAHPQLPHGSSFGVDPLVTERFAREYREVNLDLGDGSNWLQSPPQY